MALDPEKMSQEEIEQALHDAAVGAITDSDIAGEAEPEPQPEPEAPTPEPEPEPQPEESAQEPEVSEADILKAQLAEMEARAQHWERVAGNHAGKLGFLEQRLSNLEAAPVRQPETYEEAEIPAAPPAATDRDGSYKTWVVAQAIKSGVEDFRMEHPDAQEFNEGIATYLQESGYNPKMILESNDPLRAQLESKRILEEAYFAARAGKEAIRRSELVQKRADQIKNMEQLKKKSAPSASGNAPPPKPTQKSPQEMSREELDAALQEATGGRW